MHKKLAMTIFNRVKARWLAKPLKKIWVADQPFWKLLRDTN
jgi:phage terminase large subunit-like protein